MARLKAVIKDTDSLLEFYYSVGGLLSIKVNPPLVPFTLIYLFVTHNYFYVFL